MRRYWVPISRRDISPYRRRKRFLSLVWLSGLLIAGLLGAGCGKREIQLSLRGTDTLNLDENGAALPVVLRIYQLKGRDRIENADFTPLWKNDTEVLEGDIVERQELTLLPDSKVIVKVEPRKESGFLAVMALFRKRRGNDWRQVIALKGSKVHSVEIVLEEGAIMIQKVK